MAKETSAFITARCTEGSVVHTLAKCSTL